MPEGDQSRLRARSARAARLKAAIQNRPITAICQPGRLQRRLIAPYLAYDPSGADFRIWQIFSNRFSSGR
jgi:hypothetical protein